MDFSGLTESLKRNLRSAMGRDALVFLASLAVSSVFWLLLALNDEVQRDYDVPVELVDVPDEVTIISPGPGSVSVSVKDKGSSMLRYGWGGLSPLKLRFRDYATGDGRITLSPSQIAALLRGYFGSGAQLTVAAADTVAITYTSLPGVRVPVKFNIDVSSDPRYVIHGPVKASCDSVSLYAVGDTWPKANALETESATRSMLTDTTRLAVKVKAPAGMRAVPSEITLTVPVEPLISKTRSIAVEPVNVPAGRRLVTFPAEVSITYLVPMSMYGSDDHSVKAYADFDRITPGAAKMPVELWRLPESYHQAALLTDSVEYVIE